jgi:hypothetical protein
MDGDNEEVEKQLEETNKKLDELSRGMEEESMTERTKKGVIEELIDSSMGEG